jgi:hypothetical protein
MDEREFRGECVDVWKDELCVCPYDLAGTGIDRGEVETSAGDKGIDGRLV